MRGELRPFLAQSGLPDVDVDDLILAASEAAANGIEHAVHPTEPYFDVRAEVEGRRVRIVVRDYGRWTTRPVHPGGPGSWPPHDDDAGRRLADLRAAWARRSPCATWWTAGRAAEPGGGMVRAATGPPGARACRTAAGSSYDRHGAEVGVATGRVAEILSAVWAASPDGSALPAGLVHGCARALPVTGVGLALMTDGGPAGTVAATDGPALELEDLQYTLGEGPCVDASRTGRPVLQPDLAATAPRRWPAFAGGAWRPGVAAVFAFPLRVGAIRVGVLDLYRATPGTLTPGQLREALSFADAATLLLLYLQTGRR